MERHNIVIIDPVERYRVALTKQLESNGQNGIAFKDVKSFVDAESTGGLGRLMEGSSKTVFILEIGLVEQSQEGSDDPSRWPTPGVVPPEQKPFYVDDELGLSLAKRVRANEFWTFLPNTPIIFCSALVNQRIMAEVKELDVSAFIKKPFDIEWLLEAIEEMPAWTHIGVETFA